MKKERIKWIDTLRGLAMFIVIWGHSYPTNKGIIRKYIYSFHMPLFFVISGMTNIYEKEMKFFDFLKKKIKSLLVPYILINVFYVILELIASLLKIKAMDTIPNYIFGTLISNKLLFKHAASSNTWFILTLLITETIFYFIKKISKNDKDIFVLSSIVGLIGYIDSTSSFAINYPWHFGSALTGVMFYFIGYILLKNIDLFKNILNKIKYSLPLGFILGVIGVITEALNRRVSMHANLYGSIVLFYISSLSTIFALILFVNIFLKKSYVFDKIGKNTLFYLGYHYFIITIISIKYPTLVSNDIYVFITGVIVTTIMFILNYPIEKYCPILYGKLKK